MMVMTEYFSDLSSEQRAEAWKCFRRLANALTYSKKGLSYRSDKINELKLAAAIFNGIVGQEHFDISAEREVFFENLILELQEIKKRPRKAD